MWIRDPRNNQPSVTLTLLVIGFIVCTVKLLLGGLEVGAIKLAPFGGGDFAAATGALGALYWARRNAGNDKDGNDDASA
jgi:hypothetical protein